MQFQQCLTSIRAFGSAWASCTPVAKMHPQAVSPRVACPPPSPPFLFRQAKPLPPSARLPLFDLGSIASFRLHERRLSLRKWRFPSLALHVEGFREFRLVHPEVLTGGASRASSPSSHMSSLSSFGLPIAR